MERQPRTSSERFTAQDQPEPYRFRAPAGSRGTTPASSTLSAPAISVGEYTPSLTTISRTRWSAAVRAASQPAAAAISSARLRTTSSVVSATASSGADSGRARPTSTMLNVGSLSNCSARGAAAEARHARACVTPGGAATTVSPPGNCCSAASSVGAPDHGLDAKVTNPGSWGSAKRVTITPPSASASTSLTASSGQVAARHKATVDAPGAPCADATAITLIVRPQREADEPDRLRQHPPPQPRLLQAP